MPEKPPTQYIRPSGFDAGVAPHLPERVDWTPQMMFDLARGIRTAHPNDPAVQQASHLMVALINACIEMQQIVDKAGLGSR